MPLEYCTKIIEYFDEDLQDAMIGHEVVNKNTRNCLTKHLLDKEKTLGEKIVLNYVKLKLIRAVSMYSKIHKLPPLEKITQIDFLKYDANEFNAGYDYHIDHADRAADRALSLSLCLTNKFEGGELVFKDKDEQHQYVQNVGDCLIFPSNFLYPHKVNKITWGARKSIVAWFI